VSASTIQLPSPHPQQQRVLAEAARFNVVNCGRRWGKTDMGVTLAIESALDGLPVGWFAPTYKLLEEAWDRVTSTLPSGVVRHANKSERTIRLVTGGLIDFWTLKQQTKDQSVAGRGRKYALAVLDEAAMAGTLEQDWTQAVRPTLTDLRGTAWFLSTPHGRNYFWRLYIKAEQGEPGWRAWTMPTGTNPTIDPEEIEAARQELPADAFSQEYLAEFLADAANPFGGDFIRAATDSACADGPVEYWGVDLAKSYDWTVAVGLNAAGHVAAFQRWQSDWRNIMRSVRAMVGQTPALIDATGVGDPIVEELARHCQYLEGYKFSQQSKQALMEGLAVAIQSGEVRFPAGVMVTELESFIYEYTPSGRVRYTAPEGCHDDCVDALALAVMCRQRAPAAVRLDLDGSLDEADRPWLVDAVDRDELWDVY
jgi:hypothetical protein